MSNIMQLTTAVFILLTPVAAEFSRECGGFGTLTNGVCECDEQHFGETCECDIIQDSESLVVDYSECWIDNTTDIICSGRGSCICGHCECFQRENPLEITDGQFCECDNFTCPQNNGLICSGHGRCECGNCTCDPDWTGDACECSLELESCIKPGDILPCNGYGDCVCGQCFCNRSISRYYGQFCEKCPLCWFNFIGMYWERCKHLKCVICRENVYDPCERECGKMWNLDGGNETISDDQGEEYFCAFTDHSDGTRFCFVYATNSSGNLVYIRAQRPIDCPPEPPILWTLSGVAKIGMSKIWRTFLLYLLFLKFQSNLE